MGKKVILMFTNWYPTKENPLQGIFFREQALALGDKYDFLIVHYNIMYTYHKLRNKIYDINTENNIKEFQLDLQLIPHKRMIHKLKNKIWGIRDQEENYIEEKFKSVFKKQFKHEFDILYCVSGQSEAIYLKWLSDLYHKPYIVSEHGPVPWLDTIVSDYNKRAIEQADLLFAISYDKLRQIMMQGIKIANYVYVGNMVDDKQFCYIPSRNKVKTFIMVGAHVFYKDYDLLIHIMSKLKNKTKQPFKLLIVGYNANKGYSKNANELEKSIANSNFSEYVELVEQVNHLDMQTMYNRSDAFVMTSVQEGQPVSAMEAACCGLPIFSTRCGGVEDYVTEDIGRIYGILDEDGFTDGLCDFLEGRIEFDSSYIRQYAIELFGKEAFIKRMCEAFGSVVVAENNDVI